MIILSRISVAREIAEVWSFEQTYALVSIWVQEGIQQPEKIGWRSEERCSTYMSTLLMSWLLLPSKNEELDFQLTILKGKCYRPVYVAIIYSCVMSS